MAHIHKKNLIVSYKNLTDALREKFKMAYPEGYDDFLQKTIKPNGEPMFTVPLETEDTYYLVKFDVRIDSGMVEEDDLESEDKAEEEGEFAPLSEAIDKEEGRTNMRGLLHGADMEDFLVDTSEDEPLKKRKKRKEDDEDDNEEDGDFGDDNEDEEEPSMDDEGPSDEDLADIERMERDLLGDDITDLTSMPLKHMKKGTAAAPTKAEVPPKAEKKAAKATEKKAAKASRTAAKTEKKAKTEKQKAEKKPAKKK